MTTSVKREISRTPGNNTQVCAREMVETIPKVMRFIGYQMRMRSNLGISMPQMKILSFISRNSGASLSQAAEDLSVTPASASNLVDRLVKKGYVSRVADPEERRKVLLSLTKEGKEQYEEAKRVAQAAVAANLTQLSASKQEQLLIGLNILKEIFSEA